MSCEQALEASRFAPSDPHVERVHRARSRDRSSCRIDARDAAVLGIEVFEQRAPGERLPAVVARELDRAVAQPVDREAVADDAEQRGDVLDRAARCRREVGDVERGVQRIERRDVARRASSGTPWSFEPRALVVVPLAFAAAAAGRAASSVSGRRAGASCSTRRAHRQRPPAVAQEPAAGPLDHLPGLEVHRGLRARPRPCRRAPRSRATARTGRTPPAPLRGRARSRRPSRRSPRRAGTRTSTRRG